ncbi:hypothetical protein [Pseudoxanthomonas japonensis]|uniref:hypothetical protein n=1 Tax=Pseudoxanthomonas japonensis TaxID=69284 RepID=UPI0037493E0C
MSKNRISMSFAPDTLERIVGSLTALELDFEALISLSKEERRDIFRMGAKSQAFCTTALNVAEQHSGIMPRDFDIAAFRQDHDALEVLRPISLRISQLSQRIADSELALGSDLMSAALEVYGLVKGSAKDKGLDEARRQLGERFERNGRRRPTDGTQPPKV